MSLASLLSGQKVVYEDDVCVAVLGTAAKGHVRIFSKEEKPFLQLSSLQAVHLFSVANQVSVCAFDALSMQGTNIIVNNQEPIACVDVIARKENDGLSFQWELKPGDPAELDKLKDQVSDELQKMEIKQKPQKENVLVLSEQKTLPAVPVPAISKDDVETNKMNIPSVPDELLDEQDKKEETKAKKENYLFSELRRIP